MIQDFKEFADYIKENIASFLPEEYRNVSVEIKDMVKNNDSHLTGLVISEEGTNIAPTIYLESLFERYLKNGDMDGCMKSIADIYVSNRREHSIDVNRIMDFESVKNNITCRIINRESNSAFLSERPFKEVSDLAVVYQLNLGSAGDGANMSTAITNSLMEEYGVTLDELNATAMENLKEAGFSCRSMREVIREMMFPGGSEDALFEDMMLPPEPEEMPMYVITNGEKFYGAAAVLDEGFMEEVSEKLGGDYYVIPSSVHEVIAVPVNGEYGPGRIDTLSQMVKEVNQETVANEDVLSDHIYMYDAVGHELIMDSEIPDRIAERNGKEKDMIKVEVSKDHSGSPEKRESVLGKLKEKQSIVDEKDKEAPERQKETHARTQNSL